RVPGRRQRLRPGDGRAPAGARRGRHPRLRRPGGAGLAGGGRRIGFRPIRPPVENAGTTRPGRRPGGRSEEDRDEARRPPMALKPAEPQAIVIFGASGDLTKRKLLPAFWHLFSEGLLPQGIAIVGYSRTEMDDAE